MDASILIDLLEEFYTQSISKERRTEIEKILDDWKCAGENWRQALEWLQLSYNKNTINTFFSMYCLTTLEWLIHKQWIRLQAEDKAKVRERLFQYSLVPRHVFHQMITEKAIKLVVDIARIDWPHFYPDFFTQVVQLLQCPGSAHLGLHYLLTVSHELGGGLSRRQSELSVARNSELQRLLLVQLTRLYPLLESMLRSSSANIIADVLLLLSHLFQWIPSQDMPLQLVSCVFQLALPCENEKISWLALSALMEMLYRHWTPPCWTQFLQFSASFLNSSVENLSESYFVKMCELIKLVLSAHMSRDASNMDVLLNSLLRLTENQRKIQPCAMACFSIWAPLLEHPLAIRYAEIFAQLATLLLNRLQCRRHPYNLIQLKIESDDDRDSEDYAVNFALDIFVKAAEFRTPPLAFCEDVVTQWLDVKRMLLMVERNSEQSILLLKDIILLTRALAKLSPVWGDANTHAHVPIILENTLELCEFRFNDSTIPSIEKFHCDGVRCEALAALKTACYYVPNTILLTLRNKLFGVCVPALIDRTQAFSPELRHSCAHLFATLTAALRSHDLSQESFLVPLYTSFASHSSHLDPEDHFLVVGGLTNILVLPLVNPPEVATRRATELTAFVDKLTEPLRAGGTKDSLITVLQLVKYVVQLYTSEGSKQKQLLCSALKGVADHTLSLFSIHFNDTDIVEEILDLFLTFLECLQTQVGVAFVQLLVSTILNAYPRNRLEGTPFLDGNAKGLRQLFLLLGLVARTPAMSAPNAGLTSLTLELVERVEAVRSVHDTWPVDVYEAYIALVAALYELPRSNGASTQLLLLSTLTAPMVPPTATSHPSLYRSALAHLEQLNERRKMYRSAVFKTHISGPLTLALLATLVYRSQELLADEISAALCHLINADPGDFFDHHLLQFLVVHLPADIDPKYRQSIYDNFTREQDLPSIAANLSKFVNEFACYQLCNTTN